MDFETMGAMQLYRASDALMKHREAIESHLFGEAMGLFGLEPTITLYDLTNDAGEVRLYCYSEERAEKERGIAERLAQRFERDLAALHEGLSRPRTQKLDRVWQRIGRMKEKSRGAGQHYDIEVAADASGEKAVAVTWTRKPVDGSMTTQRPATTPW